MTEPRSLQIEYSISTKKPYIAYFNQSGPFGVGSTEDEAVIDLYQTLLECHNDLTELTPIVRNIGRKDEK